MFLRSWNAGSAFYLRRKNAALTVEARDATSDLVGCVGVRRDRFGAAMACSGPGGQPTGAASQPSGSSGGGSGDPLRAAALVAIAAAAHLLHQMVDRAETARGQSGTLSGSSGSTTAGSSGARPRARQTPARGPPKGTRDPSSSSRAWATPACRRAAAITRKGAVYGHEDRRRPCSYLSGQATPTTYSIFTRPLGPKCPAPVVVWGNGTGVTGSSTTTPAGACTGASPIDCLSGTYDFFNVFAASWGIVVIASDNSMSAAARTTRRGPTTWPSKTRIRAALLPEAQRARRHVGHSQGCIGATAGTNLIGRPPSKRRSASRVAARPEDRCVPLPHRHRTCSIVMQEHFWHRRPPASLGLGRGTHTGTETLAGYTGGDKGTYNMMKLYAAWFAVFSRTTKLRAGSSRAERRPTAACARTRAGPTSSRKVSKLAR